MPTASDPFRRGPRSPSSPRTGPRGPRPSTSGRSSTATSLSWAGVDVGACKGFDVAAIDARGLVCGPLRIVDVADVAAWLRTQAPRVVAVDCPCAPAPDGERSRADERAFLGARICGIRVTPDAAALEANPAYYGWILHGLELWHALGARRAIECFPTATWTRLGGPRGTRSRAHWSRDVLAAQGLAGVPARLSQDGRDAIGAALTARLHDEGATEAFGAIVVPTAL